MPTPGDPYKINIETEGTSVDAIAGALSNISDVIEGVAPAPGLAGQYVLLPEADRVNGQGPVWDASAEEWVSQPGGGGGGGSGANLTWDAPTSKVLSDSGTDATLTAADGTYSGLMTSAQVTKLANIETNATTDQTAEEILAKLLTVDGPGSSLDADTLDGLSSAAFQPYDADLAALAAAGNSAVLSGVTAAYTTGLDLKLASIAPSADVTNTASVTAAGALMDSEVASLAAIKNLNVPSGTTISAFGATLTDDADASAARTTLGVVASTVSASGLVELATTAETTTGTDATRAVTPDGLHDMTSLAGAAWFLDEDALTSNSDVKVPSQQSVKAYIAATSVPRTLTVNGHALTEDLTLDSDDVAAAPATHNHDGDYAPLGSSLVLSDLEGLGVTFVIAVEYDTDLDAWPDRPTSSTDFIVEWWSVDDQGTPAEAIAAHDRILIYEEPVDPPPSEGTVLSVVTFEDGTHNTAYTAPSGWTAPGSGTVAQANTAAAVHGTLGLRLVNASGTRVMDYADTSSSDRVMDFYMIRRAGPSGNFYFAEMKDSSTVRADVRINSTGTVSLRNAGTAVGTSTETLTVDTAYRFAWRVGSAGQELRCYVGESDTPYFTLTGALTSYTHTNLRIGSATNLAGANIDIDTLRICDDWMLSYA